MLYIFFINVKKYKVSKGTFKYLLIMLTTNRKRNIKAGFSLIH